MKMVLMFFLLFLTSCSNYIAQKHRQFDQYEQFKNNKDSFWGDDLPFYNQHSRLNRRGISTSNRKVLPPSVKRQYRPQKHTQTQKRYKASDLKDNNYDGGLWAEASGPNRGFLFTKRISIKNGDVVLVQIQKRLQEKINATLARKFSKANKKTTTSKEKKEVPISNNSSTTGEDDKIFDVISSVVIDEINNKHLILRGVKEVFYKNKKRFIELAAMADRNNIESDGSLPSNKIIENRIKVLR